MIFFFFLLISKFFFSVCSSFKKQRTRKRASEWQIEPEQQVKTKTKMLSTGQHTLTTQPDSDDSFKHCILIKLTDSSAKAIEEYLKNKVSIWVLVKINFLVLNVHITFFFVQDNTNKKPSIMFHKDKGVIKIWYIYINIFIIDSIVVIPIVVSTGNMLSGRVQLKAIISLHKSKCKRSIDFSVQKISV